jgi:hypothetical protein
VTPAQWARVFEAGWGKSGISAHEPAGNAVAKALAAMQGECQLMAGEEEEEQA